MFSDLGYCGFMKKKVTDPAAQVKRLQWEIESLKSEVNLWRTRYFELAANSRGGIRPVIRKDFVADRDYAKKAGIPMKEAIRRMEPRGKTRGAHRPRG